MTTPRIQLRALEVCAELGHPIEVLSPFERSLCIAVEERLIALERDRTKVYTLDTVELQLQPLDDYHGPEVSPTGRDPSPPPEPQNFAPARVDGDGRRRHHPKCRLDPNHKGNCKT